MADWPYSDPEWRNRVQPTVLARDGYRCQIRGPKCKGRATEVDHFVPIIEDASKAFDLDNCRAACKPCNAGRGQARLASQAKLNRQPATMPSREW